MSIKVTGYEESQLCLFWMWIEVIMVVGDIQVKGQVLKGTSARGAAKKSHRTNFYLHQQWEIATCSLFQRPLMWYFVCITRVIQKLLPFSPVSGNYFGCVHYSEKNNAWPENLYYLVGINRTHVAMPWKCFCCQTVWVRNTWSECCYEFSLKKSALLQGGKFVQWKVKDQCLKEHKILVLVILKFRLQPWRPSMCRKIFNDEFRSCTPKLYSQIHAQALGNC